MEGAGPHDQDARERERDAGQAARLAALRAGDPVVTEAWVREQAPRMRAVAMRLLRNEAAADDAVQEGFLQAFRKIENFRGEARIETWLHRIVVNAALGRVRKAARAPEVPLPANGPEFAADGHLHGAEGRSWGAIEELIEGEETRAMVRRMIDRLPEAPRTVLILRDIEELSTAEAAQALDVSVGVVKTRLHRARIALKRSIEAELAVEGAQ